MKRFYLILMFFLMVAVGSIATAQQNTQPTPNYPYEQRGDHMMMGQGMMGRGMMGPWGMRGGYGYGYGCWMPGAPGFEAYQKFLQESKSIIEELNAKRAELMALYARTNPDPKRAAKLAREITKLEEKLQHKAFQYNLPDPCPWMWRGGGHMMRGPWW